MGREEMGLQTSLVSLMDPSEFFSPTVEDLLVPAAPHEQADPLDLVISLGSLSQLINVKFWY